MKISDISINGTVLPCSEAEVTDLENIVSAKFPDNYREFVSLLGEGVISDYIRVYPPHRILRGVNHLMEWRERITEFWFFDGNETILTKEKAIESIILGDTLNGDEFIFHPSEINKIYILPRDEETIYVVEDGFLAALDWLLGGKLLSETINTLEFSPESTRNA